MATGKVNATSLNLRSSPDTGASPPVAILILNAAVDILGANDDGSFCLVSTLVDGHTQIGWISSAVHRFGQTAASR